MWDFLTFRRMLVPVIIQQFCYVAILACIVIGIILIGKGTVHVVRFGNVLAQIPVGLAVILLGPFAVRFACEMIILPFRINETLTDIRRGPGGRG